MRNLSKKDKPNKNKPKENKRVLYSIRDNVVDSALFYLMGADTPVKPPDSLTTNFGQFEYLPTSSNKVLFSIDSTFLESASSHIPVNKGILLPHLPFLDSIFFILLLVSFVIFSFFLYKERVAFAGNFSRVFSFRKQLVPGYKEQVTTTEVWGEIFMALQAILIFTIFIFSYFLNRDDFLHFHPIKWYASIFTAIFLLLSLFASLKFLMYRVIASFFLKNDVKDWITRYFRLIELMGIIFFLPVLVYIYLPEYRHFIEILLILFYLLSRLVVIGELLNIFVKNKVGFLYFFVYLCGTEIAPYILYYKGALLVISFSGNNIV